MGGSWTIFQLCDFAVLYLYQYVINKNSQLTPMDLCLSCEVILNFNLGDKSEILENWGFPDS